MPLYPSPHIPEHLSKAYSQALRNDSKSLERLTSYQGRPRRLYHLRDLTAEEWEEFRAWKARYEEVVSEGEENNWIAYDYDGGQYAVENPPKILVYDETEEEYVARLQAWRDTRDETGYVTFPVYDRRQKGGDGTPSDKGVDGDGGDGSGDRS